MCLFCTVFEFWRVIRRKWQLLLTPSAFGTLVEVTPLEFRGDLWRQKTRVPGLSCGIICVILCLAVLIQ